MKKFLVCGAVVLLLALTLTLPAVCQEGPLKAKIVEIEQARITGTLPSVIETYEGLVEANPNDASLHYLLGVAYLYADFDKENATFDNAYAQFIKAKGLDPKMKYVNNSLAYVLWSRGRFDDAIDAYKAEIALDPNSGWNYYNLGQAYEGLKQWDKAISQYIIAIDKEKKDPRIAKAYNNLGTLYMNWRGDYFRALDNFKKAVELKPNVKLYRANYNQAVKKLIELRESLDRGQTQLPPDTVDRLKKMELKEIEIEPGGA
jgi:tetratricopeptide (TPR) repeat protein